MSNEQIIYNRLRRAGMTEAAALGFLGNWRQESGCEPNRLENDFDNFRLPSRTYTARVTSGEISRREFGSDSRGYGLAQWTYVDLTKTVGRKYDLWDFWQKSGKSLDDIDMQIDFALWELHHGYAGVWDDLEYCRDLYTATDIICRQYEQPAVKNVTRRYEYAQEIQSEIDLDGWKTDEEGGPDLTQDEAINKVLTIARNEIGYHEKISSSGLDDPAANAGSGNYTKYARDLDAIPGFYNGVKNGYPWCDVFYDWLLVKAFGAQTAKQLLCQPDNSAGAGCYYSALYYRMAGRFRDRDPEPGDQIFFTFQAGEVSHTGIVEAVSEDTVVTIEGNTSDCVARKSYPIGSGSIYGYGRPDWSLVSIVDTSTPAADPISGPVYQITLRELRQGDTGKDVERLQQLLITRGYYCGGRIYKEREVADGDFGKNTEVAVKDVQLAAGLQQDGVVGEKTMTALLTT